MTGAENDSCSAVSILVQITTMVASDRNVRAWTETLEEDRTFGPAIGYMPEAS